MIVFPPRLPTALNVFLSVPIPDLPNRAMTGFCCGGFVLGSFTPAVLGWIAERASMAAGMRSLGWFYLAGGLTILVARHLFMRRPTPGNAPAARP